MSSSYEAVLMDNSDKQLYMAVYYGGHHDMNAVRSFILGFDVNTNTTLINEHILDVVKADTSDKENEKIQISIPTGGIFWLDKRTWLIRSRGGIYDAIVDGDDFHERFHIVEQPKQAPEPPKIDLEYERQLSELYEFLLDRVHLSDSPRIMAQQLLNAGWKKPI